MASLTWLLVMNVSLAAAAMGSMGEYKLKEEWKLWKTQHGKSYESERIELEKHLVWLSNKEYIDHHNANSELFGFTLAMNHHGDLVGAYYCYFV